VEGSTTRQRLATYLRQLSERDWGIPAPGAFAGHTCLRAIPPLEQELLGNPPGCFRREWIDHSLALIRQRKDCQDFAMVGMLRILFRYPKSQLLTAELRSEVESVLLAAKYGQCDPGDDSCCWDTENHQIQYASAELLAGQRFPDATFSVTGKPGGWHYERAASRVRRWLDWRLRFSFSEWNSSCYYDEDAGALLNLAEYAQDDTIRSQAGEVFQQLLFHVAVNSWNGLTGASQGRAYLHDQIKPDTTPMATVVQVCWGEGRIPARICRTAVLLAAGDLEIAAIVLRAGRDRREEFVNRERHGMDADEAAGFGLDPGSLDDYPFFAGAGQSHHHLVAETRYRYFAGRKKWPGFFSDHEYYQRCRGRGQAFDTWALPHALGHADLYTFKTPDYMLGCAQDYHPGAPGYQQFIWCATLGPRAVVFTTNPAPPGIPYGRPAPWVGNGVLPKVVQHRNVLIALHRVRPCPIYDDPPWHRQDRVHAYFPRGAFDETAEDNGWCFGRKADGYVGLKPLKMAHWAEPEAALAAEVGSGQPYEWVVEDTDVAWVCELGSRRSHGGFARFVRQLSAARIEGGIEELTYESPSRGKIATGWRAPLLVDGAAVNLHDYPRFDNPYAKVPFGKHSAWLCQLECRSG
jgi:hypothetical protein